jgi:hypothetical protein
MSSTFTTCTAGEGRHERLHDVLGAHVRDDGVVRGAGAERAPSRSSATSPTGNRRAAAPGSPDLGGVVEGARAEQRYKFQVVRPTAR